jgi:hypothetical protein
VLITAFAVLSPSAWPAQTNYDGPDAAERWAWVQIRDDKIADFGERCGKLDPRTKVGWDDACRKISPQFLVDVLTIPRWRDQLPRHRLRLTGAFIDGTIDLTNDEIAPELWIHTSRIEGDFVLANSRWDRPLSVFDSTLTGKFEVAPERETAGAAC